MKEIESVLKAGSSSTVSTILLRPAHAAALFVLGHGAGAGMRHAFLEDLAQRLGERAIATFRYQFPYMERGSGRPDPPPVLLETVEAAVAAGAEAAPDLALFAGGKSMGGRITSMAAAAGKLEAARGLIFVGYPLHAPGRTTSAAGRREHLGRIPQPMLFLQGTRDKLADIEQMREICRELGKRTRLHVVQEADHSFHVLKRSGRTDQEVAGELVETIVKWIESGAGPSGSW